MTQFPNFGLLNQMSKYVANNTSPKILDYQQNDQNGYTYLPSSNDLTSFNPPIDNSIVQQQRFNAIADQLLSSSVASSSASSSPSLSNSSSTSSTSASSAYKIQNSNPFSNVEMNQQQGGALNSLINPQLNQSFRQSQYNNHLIHQNGNNEIPNTGNSGGLNTSVTQERINDNIGKESFGLFSKSNSSESEVRINIITIIIVCFIVFMLIQLYLSQKKLEFMMNVYKSQTISNTAIQQGNGKFTGGNSSIHDEIF